MKLARPLLLPFVPLYRLTWRIQDRRISGGMEEASRLRWPVISVGNLSTGGTGKTPLVIALAQGLAQRGLHVDILSRGYGRSGKDPVLVAPDGSAREFGDEPLLMTRATGAPVYVGAERFKAGVLAESEVPEGRPAVHILDDGFQHRKLYRELDILLLNWEDWHNYLLPAGNLREPREAVLRASIIAIPADDTGLEEDLRAFGWPGPIWHLRRQMQIPQLDGPVLAFCGIARPAQFFAGLQAAGVPLAARIAFRDHHRFTQRELDRLCAVARQDGATQLLTTEKDAVRLGALTTSLPLKTAPLRIEVDEEAEAFDWLASYVAARQRQSAPVRK
ncbi:MAG: tetraacyldisaccharide 4'-kinase [Acidobacteriota bacterium]